jgi:hypothetical protein
MLVKSFMEESVLVCGGRLLGGGFDRSLVFDPAVGLPLWFCHVTDAGVSGYAAQVMSSARQSEPFVEICLGFVRFAAYNREDD